MNVGLYEGATALGALQRWQAVISQNIASASVPGFKGSETSFQGVDYGTIQDKTGVRSSTQAAIMPNDSTQTSFQPGSVEHTGNPTDFAISGKGFFAVQDTSGQTLYTRNGQFSQDATNQLVTSTGAVVQGVGGPVQLLPNGQDVNVDSGGQIYQGNQLIGRLKVVEFADTSKLSKASGGFVANGAEGTSVATPGIQQGYLEGSNVSTVGEMVKLIQVERAQEANQKSIQAYDDRMGKVISTFTR